MCDAVRCLRYLGTKKRQQASLHVFILKITNYYDDKLNKEKMQQDVKDTTNLIIDFYNETWANYEKMIRQYFKESDYFHHSILPWDEYIDMYLECEGKDNMCTIDFCEKYLF